MTTSDRFWAVGLGGRTRHLWEPIAFPLYAPICRRNLNWWTEKHLDRGKQAKECPSCKKKEEGQ